MSDLTALLEREASAEIDAILSDARERASEIVAAARAEAEANVAARERASAQQREALLVRAQSAAQLEAAALRLRAQHEAVEGAFAAAVERLEALTDDEKAYRDVLAALLREAVDAVGADSVDSVVAAKRDVALVKELLGEAGVKAKVAAGDVRGGLRVRTTRGGSVENSLFGRLEALRAELASDVSKVLFDETPEG